MPSRRLPLGRYEITALGAALQPSVIEVTRTRLFLW